MSSFTRRRRGVVSTIVIAACVIAACSSDDDSSDGSNPAVVSATTDGGSAPTTGSDGEATPTTDGSDATASSAPSGDGPSGTLRAATYNAPTSLDAHLLGLGQNIQFAQPVYETLIRKLPDGTYVPMLATEWSYLDEERLLLEFKLRDDVDFTDGAHFDANAVKLSFDRFKTDFPEGNALIAALEEVEVVDDYTVHLHLSSPMPSILLTLSTNPTGSIISPDAIDNEDLSINPVGSGPYIFDQDSFVEGSFYAYDANPDYRDKSIQGLERIEYTVIEDLDARYNAIVADQVDIAPGMPEQIEDAEAAGLKIVQHPVDWYGVILFDRDGTINPALGDPRVRQAMNYAVNRQEIVDTILGGAGQITSQIYPPGSPARDESLTEYYTYDPDKARALLAEAGYADGFEFTSPVTPGSRYMEAVAGYLAEVGITLNMEVSEGAAFIDAVVSGDYESAYFSFGMEHPFQDNAFVLLPGGPLNVLDTDDPEIAAWNLEAAGLPEDEAAEIYKKINKKVVEEAWVLVTHFQDSVLLINDRVSGMEPYVSQDSMSIYNWRIED